MDWENNIQESQTDTDTIGEIISQFDEIDQRSQTFRYPVTRSGGVVLDPIQIDMQRIREAMGWASQFLDSWSSGIYECWQEEQRIRYEARIQDSIDTE